MVDRFNPSSILQSAAGPNRSSIPNIDSLSLPYSDNRTRAERQEDFEKELEELDLDALEALKEVAIETSDPLEFFELKNDIENSLVKLIDSTIK